MVSRRNFQETDDAMVLTGMRHVGSTIPWCYPHDVCWKLSANPIFVELMLLIEEIKYLKGE